MLTSHEMCQDLSIQILTASNEVSGEERHVISPRNMESYVGFESFQMLNKVLGSVVQFDIWDFELR